MRKLVSILLVLMLCTALLCIPAQAATTRLMYQNYDVVGTTLSCYGVPLPVGGDLSVSVGSTTMSDATLSTIADEEVPITVYFLVDASSSLSNEIMKQQTDILSVISGHLREKDTMVIATIDDTFVEGPLLTDKDSRDTAIETLGRKGSWQTNLLYGIDQAVDSLCTSTAFETNRYLVILSDGHSEQQDLVNKDALVAKVAANNIPVFNLILGPAGGLRTADELDYYGLINDANLGGFLCQLAKDNVSAAEAAENIWSTIQENTVIRFNGASLDTSADVELLIRYDYKDNRYEDTILFRAVDLQKRLVIPARPAAEPSIDLSVDVTPTKNTNIVYYIGGGAVLIMIIAIVAFLLLKPKNTASAPDPFADSLGGNPDFGYTGDSGATDFATQPTAPVGGGYGAESYGATMPVGTSTAPVKGGVQVSLVALMHPEITCQFTVGEGAETTVGRDSRANMVLNGSDRKLSGLHAGILWDGAHLLIRDKKSTNGTSVNGSPCAGDAWYLLENGATIKAGSYEYRVTYQR